MGKAKRVQRKETEHTQTGKETQGRKLKEKKKRH